MTIEELPVCVWVEEYLKVYKDKHMSASGKEATNERFIKSIENLCTDVKVNIRFNCWIVPPDSELEKILKMSTKLSIKNVHLFDGEQRLVPFTIPAIFEEHRRYRVDLYAKRRAHNILEVCKKTCSWLRIRNVSLFLSSTAILN